MDFSAYLAEQKQKNLYRQRYAYDSPQGVLLKQGEKALLNFCSNDYLGLAKDERIIKACQQALNDYGLGSGASQLICGYHRCHEELELALAEFTGREKALLFNSGYTANLAAHQSLLDRHSTLFMDRFAHASIIDGARLSGARIKRYQHGKTDDLKRLLQNTQTTKGLIATDSVFSMDGDLAPLAEINHLAKEKQIPWLMDDAHGFGVLGAHGQGALALCSSGDIKPDIYLATFGKALGAFGAFIAAEEDTIEYLIQKSRGLIYSTAPPPALAKAALVSLNIAEKESWRRECLNELIDYFRAKAHEAGLPLTSSLTAIQPIILGEEKAALAMSRFLLDKGILVAAIRPPTVPQGTARLRVTLTASHTRGNIDGLVDTISAFMNHTE